MGFGESEGSPIGATRLNAFDAPTAKRDATGEVPTAPLPRCVDGQTEGFVLHTHLAIGVSR